MKSPWHDTLGQALDAAFAELKEGGAVISTENETLAREAFAFGGMKYNETRISNVPLDSLKGKPTKKFGHATIYRAESGRYEVTTYVL